MYIHTAVCVKCEGSFNKKKIIKTIYSLHECKIERVLLLQGSSPVCHAIIYTSIQLFANSSISHIERAATVRVTIDKTVLII